MGGTGYPSNGRGGEEADGVRIEYDWTETAPTRAVVETIAAVADRDPSAIDPLYEYVDPDALDELVRPGGDGSRAGATVSFTYVGYEVTVDAGGAVEARRVGPDER